MTRAVFLLKTAAGVALLSASAAVGQPAYPAGTFQLTPAEEVELVPSLLQVPASLADRVPDDITLHMPPGFQANVFAAAPVLSGPRFMDFSADGVLHVAAMRAGGAIVALPDADGDGVADAARVVAEGFEWINNLQFHDGDLYVADYAELLRLRDTDGDGVFESRQLLAPLPTAPADRHGTRTVLVDTARQRLLVSIGSSCDVCREEDPERASVVAFDLDGGGRQIFASGLRNAVGMALHPETGDLWVTVNGHDGEGQRLPPERIDIIREGGFYGWPLAYGYRSWVDLTLRDYGAKLLPLTARDTLLVQSMTRPVALTAARLAPMGIHFYRGHRFPARYQGQAFVALRAGHHSHVPGWKVLLLRCAADGTGATLSDFMVGLGPLEMDSEANLVSQVRGQPVGVTSDARGDLYVTSDWVNHMVLRVTHDGPGTAVTAPSGDTGIIAGPSLQPNHPNPFNAATTIRFDLPSQERVHLAVHDITGRRVRTLVNRSLAAGGHRVDFDGRDEEGRQLASGVYLWVLRGGGVRQVRKALLLR
jgi:glucose/arabinose dehydrogenase